MEVTSDDIFCKKRKKALNIYHLFLQNAIHIKLNTVYNIQITSQVITNIWNIVESGIKQHKPKCLHPSTPSIILNTLKNTGRNGTRLTGNVARMVFNI